MSAQVYRTRPDAGGDARDDRELVDDLNAVLDQMLPAIGNALQGIQKFQWRNGAHRSRLNDTVVQFVPTLRQLLGEAEINRTLVVPNCQLWTRGERGDRTYTLEILIKNKLSSCRKGMRNTEWEGKGLVKNLGAGTVMCSVERQWGVRVPVLPRPESLRTVPSFPFEAPSTGSERHFTAYRSPSPIEPKVTLSSQIVPGSMSGDLKSYHYSSAETQHAHTPSAPVSPHPSVSLAPLACKDPCGGGCSVHVVSP